MNYKPHKGNSFAVLLLSVTLLLGFLPAILTHAAQFPVSAQTEWVAKTTSTTRGDDQQLKKPLRTAASLAVATERITSSDSRCWIVKLQPTFGK